MSKYIKAFIVISPVLVLYYFYYTCTNFGWLGQFMTVPARCITGGI